MTPIPIRIANGAKTVPPQEFLYPRVPFMRDAPLASNNMVPISRNVTLVMIRVSGAFFIAMSLTCQCRLGQDLARPMSHKRDMDH